MSTLNILQTREILDYKKFGSETSLSEIEIPETARNRQRTDKHFLTIFLVLLLISISFLIYTLYYSDIARFNGYDSCGNVCGQKNARYPEWDCTGKDMTDKPKYHNRACQAATFQNLWEDATIESEIEDVALFIQRVGWKITLASFISLGYCIITVVLFRHATAVLVWGILILSWTCLFTFTFYLWKLVGEGYDNAVTAAIICSAVVLGLLCVLCFMQRRIPLVIMLFKESSKAVFDMALIFILPTMTIFGTIMIAIVASVSTTYMSSSGMLTEMSPEYFDYVMNPSMIIAIILNIIMAVWAIEFIIGFQHMVISGAISKWYFTGNKTLLGSPILTSALIAFKFHLGTIALGSLVITLVAILRGMIRSLAANHRLRLLVICCMNHIEKILKFFTKNCYIMTAMHGTSFLSSGRQAVKLITLNICNTIVVNNIADFVVVMAQVLLVSLSVMTTFIIFLGEKTSDGRIYYCYAIVVLITALCSYSIMKTFQIAVDTMFMCFCEDCLINDGISKPYAMPRGFMEFVQSSKKMFEEKIQKKGLPTI